MINAKSDRHDVTAPRRSEESKSYEPFEPTTDSIANGADRQGVGSIEGLLSHGEKNATSIQDLLIMTGISTRRELQLQIQAERLTGALILSSTKAQGGYFLPSCDPEQAQNELLTFQRSLMSRARSTFRVLNPVNRQLRILRGQTSFADNASRGGGDA